MTKEIAWHAHDTASTLIVCHFAWRAWLLATTGSSGLDGGPATAACIVIHTLLHITAVRTAYVGTWPEMRWQAAVLAARSITVLGAAWLASDHGSDRPFAEAVAQVRSALYAFAPEVAGSPAARMSAWVASALDSSLPVATAVIAFLPVVRVVSVMLAMLMLDVVSAAYGMTASVVVNPFPAEGLLLSRAASCVSELAQIGGTLVILCSADMAPLLFVMLPIQAAPMLMTLVNRGVLRQRGLNTGYLLSIIVAYTACAVVGTQPEHNAIMTVTQAGAIVVLCGVARAVLGVSKYAMWLGIAAAVFWRQGASPA